MGSVGSPISLAYSVGLYVRVAHPSKMVLNVVLFSKYIHIAGIYLISRSFVLFVHSSTTTNI